MPLGSARITRQVVAAYAPRPSQVPANVSVFDRSSFVIDDRGRTIWPAERLIGPPEQTAGGVWVISSREQMRMLLDVLWEQQMTGLDTEFDGVNLKKESPRGKGQIACWSVAYQDEALGRHPQHKWLKLSQRVFIPHYGKAEDEGWMYDAKEWLESEAHGKAGSYFMSTDMHLFANHGLAVHGVKMDSVRMSQTWRMGRVYEHGLKVCMEELLGYKMGEYKELFAAPVMLKNGQPSESKTRVMSLRDEVVHDPRMLSTLVDYASLDPKGSLETCLVIAEKLDEIDWRNGETLHAFNERYWNPYQYVVWGMEDAGWPVDREWLVGKHKQAQEDMRNCEVILNRWAGAEVNWSSWPQKQHLLYETTTRTFNAKKKTSKGVVSFRGGTSIQGKGFPVPEVNKGGPVEEGEKPTDAVAIQWVRDHARKKEDKDALLVMMRYTKYETIDKMFLASAEDRIRPDGKMYSRIGTEAETGRLTSKMPPFNVLPRPGWNENEPWEGDPYDVREGYTCESDELLVGIDFSQLEMRILAHYMIMLFNDRGLADDLAEGDLHSNTALRVWGNHPLLRGLTASEIKGHKNPLVKLFRNRGKVLNFSINYGKTAYSLGSQLRDEDGDPIGKPAAQDIIDQYFKAYPGVIGYHKWTKKYAHSRGYVRDLFGGYRYLPGIHSPNKRDVSSAERASLNTPIQMSAARIVMLAMLRLNVLPIPDLIKHGWYHEELVRYQPRLMMQVHDELIWRVKKRYAEKVLEIGTYEMERPFDRDIVGFPGSNLPLPCNGAIGTTYRELK